MPKFKIGDMIKSSIHGFENKKIVDIIENKYVCYLNIKTVHIVKPYSFSIKHIDYCYKLDIESMVSNQFNNDLKELLK